MARNENDRQVNVTMSEEARKQLDEFCAKNGMSINAAMNRGRELLMMDKLRSLAPEQATNIEQMEMYMNSIMGLYRVSIEASLHARKIAEAEVKGQLDGMSELSDTLRRTQTELETMRNKYTDSMIKNNSLTNEVAALKLALDNATAKEDETESLRKKVIELTQLMSDEKLRHNEDIAALQEENFNKILRLVQLKDTYDLSPRGCKRDPGPQK